jgi:tetratricopeptide (TPR) repeat protein
MMRRLALAVVLLGISNSAPAAVVERFLSPDRPLDRVIMKYMELDREGKATSMDLANLGVLVLEKGFVHDAEDYLRKALKLDKHNYEAAYRLGLVLQRDGRDREAVPYYKLTVKQRPGYAQARFMLALAEERCGRRQAAIRDYVRAYRHAPDLANGRINPLVYDSRLQTEAMLEHYRETVPSTTLAVTEVDPEAVRRMMEALAPEARPTPPPAGPQPPPAQAPAAQGQPAAPPQPPVRPGRGLPGGFEALPAPTKTPRPAG